LRHFERSEAESSNLLFGRFLHFGPLRGPSVEMTKAQILITIGITTGQSPQTAVARPKAMLPKRKNPKFQVSFICYPARSYGEKPLYILVESRPNAQVAPFMGARLFAPAKTNKYEYRTPETGNSKY